MSIYDWGDIVCVKNKSIKNIGSIIHVIILVQDHSNCNCTCT